MKPVIVRRFDTMVIPVAKGLRRNLVSKGVDPTKIGVIINGVLVYKFPLR